MRYKMPPIKKKVYLLFIVVSLLLPLSVSSQTCAQLGCFSLGKTCIQTLSGVKCVDYCKNRDLAVAPVGGCAVDRRYCSAGGFLTSKCDLCGCSIGEKCQADGACVKVCNDGTLDNQCSAQKPLYCQDDKLVENSNACGCDSSKVPQQDGSCGFKSFIRDSTLDDFVNGSQIRVKGWGNVKNLALEGTAFASSVYDAPSDWWFTPLPELANDGLVKWSGDWASELGTRESVKNQFIGIEWNEEKTFNEMWLMQSLFRAKSYKVQYFKDGNWIDATKENKLEYFPKDFERDQFNMDLPSAIIEKIKFKPVTAKKVRIFFPECYWMCRVDEIGVFDSEKDSLKLGSGSEGSYISKIHDTLTAKNNIVYDKIFFSSKFEALINTTSKNIAPEGTVIASSTYGGLSWINKAYVNDNNANEYKFWTRGNWNERDAWIGIEWQNPRTINKIAFQMAVPSIQCFGYHSLQYWDGSGWKDIATPYNKGSPNYYREL